MVWRRLFFLISVSLLCTATAPAAEKEPFAELEIGAASEWSLPGGGTSLGPSAAIEFSAIKDRLEIEMGVSPRFGNGQREWDTELTFKSPILSTPATEVFFALGPEWQHRSGRAETADVVAGVASLDFQFWQPDKKFGWFIEPSYSHALNSQHEQSLGVTMGLLIAIP